MTAFDAQLGNYGVQSAPYNPKNLYLNIQRSYYMGLYTGLFY